MHHMCPFSWPSSQGTGMKNSLMSAIVSLLFSCLFIRLLSSLISIINGSSTSTGTAAWVGAIFNFFDFRARSWTSILSVSLLIVMAWAQGLLVVATGGSGDEPTSESMGIDISIGVVDPWRGSMEAGGMVQWWVVKLGIKLLASSIYFAGRCMVQTGWADIAEPAKGVYGVVEGRTSAFYWVWHDESVSPWESALEQFSVSQVW